MYKVSDSYLRAIMASSVVASWSGTLTTKDGKTYAFEDADIMSDKSRYTHEICANTVLDIGTAYSAGLVLGLYLDIDRYTLYNAEVKLYFTLYLDDEGTQKENVPLGIFTVKDTELSTNGVVLTAYDAMQNFSTEASFDLSGEPYDFLNVACRSCGVKLGMTQAEIRELPNGRTSISTYNSKETISTWTDAVGYIAQFLGGYAIIDTDGSLVIRQYKTTTTRVIDASWRYDLTLSDYETKYRAIKLYNMREKSYETYGSDVVADGLVYTIGKNPFLQFEQQSTRERIANNILGAINQFSYTPYTAHVPLDPALQVGDILEFTGGQAVEGKKSVITSIDLKLSSSMTIKGVGENPRLKAIQDSGGDSSEEIAEISKDISKINGSINSLIYDFNTEPIVVGQEETTVAMIPYYVTQDVDVEGHLKLNFKANGPSHLIIRFYDDQVEELWSPIETDIVKGDNEIGIPHSYLDRKVGYHSAFVTVQCTLSSFVLDTRGVYFTINAGSYAEPSDDLSMDVLDLSMRQLLESNGPDQIWFVGLENGEFTLSHRNYDPTNKQRIEITGVYNAGKALAGACEFDGEWVLRTGADKFTLETDAEPWIFWVAIDHTLYAQHGSDEGSRFVMDIDVSSVHACKGYSSQMYKSQDQGLVVVYVTNSGLVYYKQYTLNTETDKKVWSNAIQLAPNEIWTEANIHRLNDYRLGFELANSSHNIWILTGRTYVGQSVYPENANFNSNVLTGFSFFNKDEIIDFTGKALLFSDPTAPQKVFQIRYAYPIKSRDDYFSNAIEVYVNGNKLNSDDYTVELHDNAIVIILKNEVAATRAKEALVKICVSAKDTDFYLSNGNTVNRLILDDAEYDWTIERKIVTVNTTVDEKLPLNIQTGCQLVTRQIIDLENMQNDSSTMLVAPVGSYTTTTIKHIDTAQTDSGSISASITSKIMTYMVGDAPI